MDVTSQQRTGRQYEALSKKVFEGLLKLHGLENVSIEQNLTVEGKTRDVTGAPVKHAIDVFWQFSFGGITYKTIVECKNWKSAVSKEKVLAFKALLDDIPSQPRGIMISSSRFQSGADKFARTHGIVLFRLRELGKLSKSSFVFKRFATIPRLVNLDIELDYEWAGRFAREHDVAGFYFSGTRDSLILVDKDYNELGSIPQLLLDLLPHDWSPDTGQSRVGQLFKNDLFFRTGNPSMPLARVLGATADIICEERSFEESVNLSGMFTHILQSLTGEASFNVDSQMQVHYSTGVTGLCDFCIIGIGDSAPEFEVEPFMVRLPTGFDFKDNGFWATCDVCARLIRDGETEQLLNRSLLSPCRSTDPRSALIYAESLVLIHDRFWSNFIREIRAEKAAPSGELTHE
jgi:hypothetical protein